MSMLSKVFVFVNLFLAIVFSTVTIALYAKRVKFKHELIKEQSLRVKDNEVRGDMIKDLNSKWRYLVADARVSNMMSAVEIYERAFLFEFH